MSAQPATRPFEEIPLVPYRDEYAAERPRWIARLATTLGPVFRIDYSPEFRPVYLVGPEANRLVLYTDRDAFSHDLGWSPIIGADFGHGILNMDGEQHAHHRRIMNPAFTMAYMTRYLPLMNEVIRERTANWAGRGQVNLWEETRRITFDVAAGALTGQASGPGVDRLRELFVALMYGYYDPDVDTEESWLERHESALRELRGMLTELIRERRARPTDDLIGRLVSARDERGEPMSDEQLIAHLNILLIAGHETSTTMSAWLLYLLATHPECLARVHDELDRVLGDSDAAVTMDQIRALKVLGNALNEAGRLYPPVGAAPRGTTRDVEFAGYHIPAGTQVRYSIAGSHWLPSVFQDPERFDPDRFAPPREEDRKTPYAYVPFGGGARICLGVNFAQVEIKALAAYVLRRYSLEAAPDRPAEQLYWDILGSPERGLWVDVQARS